MPTLIDQLILHEGIRLKPYTDPVGKVTIGVGRNLTDVGISMEEARILLVHDLEMADAALQHYPWFRGLDAIRRRVLIDMCFNMGPAKLATFQLFMASVARAQWDEAANNMFTSAWRKQVGNRATRLIQMMRTGQDYIRDEPRNV